MHRFPTLNSHLGSWAGDDVHREAVADTIIAIARASTEIAGIIADGKLRETEDVVTAINADGDEQAELDVIANDILIDALWSAPVAYALSEELDKLVPVRAFEPLYVALDPLDGSSNIDTNVSVGTIFSILPVPVKDQSARPEDLLQAGNRQLAAGYVIYGPQTSLVLTIGAGTQIFTLDAASGEFRLTSANVRIATAANEFAINASNYRYWDRHIRAYVDDCLDGADGHLARNYNMRWVASLVAEAHRILSRGGAFLYPGDARDGYAAGRLRLIYEANPIAWLIEQAGGAATTGWQDILSIEPQALHERVPLIFGSSEEVQRVERYYDDLHPLGNRSPLFNQRGLFRT